jgi:phage baseplate assembly protein W
LTTTTTVYKDLNVKLSKVDNSDATIITDEKVVVQSIWRLFTTQEGEIPYYRGYGLNLKQFIQKPLTKATVKDIHEHVKNKIGIYESRVEVIQADASADIDNGIITMIYSVKIKSTGQLVTLQALKVPVNG